MFKPLSRTQNDAGVEIKNFPNALRDVSTVSSIVSLYQNIFGHEPWGEGYRCPVCNARYERSHKGRTCEACEPRYIILLVEYWPRSRVLENFYTEMVKPQATCLLAKSEEGIVGFAWGYTILMSEEESLRLEAPGLHHKFYKDFFYIDEVALTSVYRGKGIGTHLVSALADSRKLDIMWRVLRDSPAHKIMQKMGGSVVQDLSDGRVLMAT